MKPLARLLWSHNFEGVKLMSAELRRFFVTTLAAVLSIGIQTTVADEGRNLPRIGLAVPVSAVADVPYNTALRQGLREHGYVDGENIILIARYANGDPMKYPEIIQELIALDVDILFGEAAALKAATTTIPIVSATMDDPVKTGLVSSLARPGGNVTGLSAQAFDIWPKHLELARELLPNLKHLCVLLHMDQYAIGAGPEESTYEEDFESLARSVGVKVSAFPASSFEDLEAALTNIRKRCSEALIVRTSPLMLQYRDTVLDAVTHQLPVISDGKFSAEAGTLLSYSADYRDMFRRSAEYMAKILNGAKPGDLPIQQPRKFKVTVNLKIASELGVAIPESIMVRADDIVQ
ncbi:MAG: ABC transporter substrate-binding protein [Betaproteobacteria bacterium]|nr:MAG: ABC transporter substrate-binding protein [Betaproteobacteria bacterium]